MRSYEQYCSLAKALDVVGDRWTLLIVRELLSRGTCRYTDLQRGLPGIATNLLAERLRHLEEHGIVTKSKAPPPVATTVFRLTPRGEELQSVVFALGRWGLPLLPRQPSGEVFQSHWFALPLRRVLGERTIAGPPTTLEVRTGDEPITITSSASGVEVHVGEAHAPDAVLTGTPALVMELLLGVSTLDGVRGQGLVIEGSEDAIVGFLSTSDAASAAPRPLVATDPRR